MTTMTDEPVVLLIEGDILCPSQEKASRINREEVRIANRAAADVDAKALEAFLELLYAADVDYIDAGPPPGSMSQPLLDWDEVGIALAESQAMLKAMQALLSTTLEEMGVEDHDGIRMYEDREGAFRLVVDHPRRREIEDVLNAPNNRQLQELYRAAVNGMSLAGSLVGNGAIPFEALEKAKKSAIGA